MVKFAVEFWWKMFLTISPAKEARRSPAKLRRKFATNFAENFANFTLEIAGSYHFPCFPCGHTKCLRAISFCRAAALNVSDVAR